MNNSIQKLLFNLSVISVISLLFITGVQAATYSELMKLGVVNSSSPDKEVVIYNDDYTKCLSANGQERNSSGNLAYTACRIDATDTWLITSEGKIKNKQSGKCLSTPKGEDSLILAHCDFLHFRNDAAHELIIFGAKVDDNHDTAEIAEVRY